MSPAIAIVYYYTIEYDERENNGDVIVISIRWKYTSHALHIASLRYATEVVNR